MFLVHTMDKFIKNDETGLLTLPYNKINAFFRQSVDNFSKCVLNYKENKSKTEIVNNKLNIINPYGQIYLRMLHNADLVQDTAVEFTKFFIECNVSDQQVCIQSYQAIISKYEQDKYNIYFCDQNVDNFENYALVNKIKFLNPNDITTMQIEINNQLLTDVFNPKASLSSEEINILQAEHLTLQKQKILQQQNLKKIEKKQKQTNNKLDKTDLFFFIIVVIGLISIYVITNKNSNNKELESKE